MSCRFVVFCAGPASLLTLLVLTSTARGVGPQLQTPFDQVVALGATIEKDTEDPPGLYVNLAGTPLSDEQLMTVAKLENLRSVDVSGTAVTPRGIRVLLRRAPLQVAILSRMGLHDSDIRFLRQGQEICDLDLSGNTALTGNGFKHLSLPQLRRLDLSNVAVTTKGLARVRDACPHLGNLDIEGATLSVDACRSIAQMTALKRLNLSSSALSDKHLAGLAGLVNLEVLCLWDTDISDGGLRWLAGAVNLRELWLGGTRAMGESAVCFPRLESLELNSPNVDNRTIHFVLQCDQLKRLYLTQNAIAPGGVSGLKTHPTLQLLKLTGFQLANEDLLRLSELRKLCLLKLTYCRLPPTGLQGLERFDALRKLEVIGCDLSEQDVRLLAGTRLEEITIRDVAIQHEWFVNAPELRKLKRITLESSRFSRDAKSHIVTELPNVIFD